MFFSVAGTLLGWLMFLWILHRWWKKHIPWTSFFLLMVAALLRLVLGMAYGYIYLKYYHGDDTWYYNSVISEEYQKLLHQPWQFLVDPNPITAFARYSGFRENWYYYLVDLENWLLTKPLAFVQPITQGNYYLNIVFYNCWTIWGSLLLLQWIGNQFPHYRKQAFLWLFFFPPLLFWWSGIRSDGLLVLFSALLLASMSEWLNGRGKLRWGTILVALLGIGILRNAVLFVWLPALVSWFVEGRLKTGRLQSILVVYGAGIILFFASEWLNPSLSLPRMVANRQQEFLQLKGQTRLALDTLKPDPFSFLTTTPQALQNTFLRPFLWEAKGPLQLLTSLEMTLLLLLIIRFAWQRFRHPQRITSPPELFYPMIFGLCLFLFIGLTIPFPGAIVRYKALGEVFLFIYITQRKTG
ncbi:MAG: hypothetical protein ACKO7A_30150 [Microcystis sp.]